MSWHARLVEGAEPRTKISYAGYVALGVLLLPFIAISRMIPAHVGGSQRWQTGLIISCVFSLAVPLMYRIYDTTPFVIYCMVVGGIVLGTILYGIHLHIVHRNGVVR